MGSLVGLLRSHSSAQALRRTRPRPPSTGLASCSLLSWKVSPLRYGAVVTAGNGIVASIVASATVYPRHLDLFGRRRLRIETLSIDETFDERRPVVLLEVRELENADRLGSEADDQKEPALQRQGRCPGLSDLHVARRVARPEPRRFAAYIAVSAWLTSVSASARVPHIQLTPMCARHDTRFVLSRTWCRSVSAIRVAVCMASAKEMIPGHTTSNSSSPIRPTRSSPRTRLTSCLAMTPSSSSPAAWPNRSLTSLKHPSGGLECLCPQSRRRACRRRSRVDDCCPGLGTLVVANTVAAIPAATPARRRSVGTALADPVVASLG